MERPKGLLQHYNWDIQYTDDEDLSYFLVPTGLQHQLLNKVEIMAKIIEQLLDEGHAGAISFELYTKADNFYKKFKEWK